MSNTQDKNLTDQLRVDLAIDDCVANAEEVDQQRLRQAATSAAEARGYSVGVVGIRVTDDPSIHQINRDHLGHDYPTDVISFAYENEGSSLNGELVVSLETARQQAKEIGWPAGHELLLYVIHGVLHIAGMDDHEPAERAAMRAAEKEVMTSIGIHDFAQFHPDHPKFLGDQS